jgi:hypothetical protein
LIQIVQVFCGIPVEEVTQGRPNLIGWAGLFLAPSGNLRVNITGCQF